MFETYWQLQHQQNILMFLQKLLRVHKFLASKKDNNRVPGNEFWSNLFGREISELREKFKTVQRRKMKAEKPTLSYSLVSKK